MPQSTSTAALRIVDDAYEPPAPNDPALMIAKLQRELRAAQQVGDVYADVMWDADALREQYAIVCARQNRQEAEAESSRIGERHRVERMLSPDGRARPRHLQLVK